MSAYPHLLSPLQVGALTLRNRALVTAHVPGLERGGLVTDDFIAYQRARAKGGAAMQISGSAQIHRTGAVGAGRSLDNTNPAITEGYKRLADAVHNESGRFLIQLGHAAGTVADTDAGRPLWAPSDVTSELNRETPHVMSIAEIHEIVDAYGAAAARVREGGLDGVEILAAFGQLPVAFLSPFTNRRDDDYGGPLENRLRFLREVIAAVRDAAGPHAVVGLRLPGDERVEGGLTEADMVEIAPQLAATGKIDYLNVIVGTNYERLGRMEHWPPTPAPYGLYVSHAATLKKAVDIPVFTTGRITHPDLAEKILRDGAADMVGLTRAHIADPDFIAKLSENRADDIRPCVGANVCVAQATEGKPVRCFVNALAAREHAWGEIEPAATPKRIAVIGGGPAGLEAARVAALRGHQVSVYEAATTLGGQLRTWSQTPMASEFGKIIDWYEHELRQRQVPIHIDHAITQENLADLETDAVILATGSTTPQTTTPQTGPNGSVIPVTPAELIAAPPADKHILLVDEGGGRIGLAAIDAALDTNRITIVTSQSAVGELVNPNLRTPLYKRLLAGNATFRPCEKFLRLEGTTAITRNIYAETEHRIPAIDVLVDWRGNRATDHLTTALRGAGIPFEIAGDALAPRQVHIAIAEGMLAGRAV